MIVSVLLVDALLAYPYLSGAYLLSDPVNGKKSWLLEKPEKGYEYAIWYVPEYNEWTIGPLEDKGTNIRYITSVNGQGSLNLISVPEDKWNFWNDIAQSWISVGLGDINVLCRGKKFLRKLTASQSTQSRPTLSALLEPWGSIFQNGFLTPDLHIKKE